MTLNELVAQAHSIARSKGWHDSPRPIAEALALVHSEVSEALEAARDGRMETYADDSSSKPEGFPAELADVVIRVADLCGELGIDLESEVARKMAYNATRPHRHGGKLF